MEKQQQLKERERHERQSSARKDAISECRMRDREECDEEEHQNAIMEPEDECEPAMYAANTQVGPSIFDAAATANEAEQQDGDSGDAAEMRRRL